ncbi:hypothetical protein IY145_16570 [Methylosinus sp. H3A]|uniref:hypothetical protein n=1 Tax=Methylosinus sp. H3A TaxID=2785786 RepID=UPI0018C1DBF1|nr:hypothetical protein [Methylosinus sp. H3A]MBG0810986.1 hypothetical protein [Methylosinus sp. H3A]
MTKARGATPRPARAFVALLAVLPLLLQLLFAATPFALATSARAEVAVTAPNCETQDHRPAPAGGGAHSHCCLLCECSARDGAAVIGSFIVAEIGADAHATPIRAAPDRPRHAPIGWTTSWSSRAPPLFS